jgi:hypothetical protein
MWPGGGGGADLKETREKFSAIFCADSPPLMPNAIFYFFIHYIFATPSPPLEDKIMKIIEFLGGCPGGGVAAARKHT